MNPAKTVLVLGGGVSGLTVAHELLDRGFDVTVCDSRRASELGGKARSFTQRPRDPVTGDVLDISVPAEHGFRFFPGFYRHLDDTLCRIPLPEHLRRDDRTTVRDCLVSIDQELLAVTGRPPISVPAAVPTTIDNIRSTIRFPKRLLDLGLTDEDLSTFANKLWQIATSCKDRRDKEYELIGWRDFVDSKDRSSEYYWYLASGLTRSLVAAKARYASTKTMGNIALQLWTSLYHGNFTTDRVLCGPTNEVWIEPWLAHLQAGGAPGGLRKGRMQLEAATVEHVVVQDGRVDHVVARKASRGGAGEVLDLRADYFVSALPLDQLVALLKTPANEALRRSGGDQFQALIDLEQQLDRDVDGRINQPPSRTNLKKMSGLQIYLKKDEPLNRGHQLFLDSPWGLTSISQAQFWDRGRLERLEAAAKVGGILSVDISSWDMPGLKGGSARGGTADDALADVPTGLTVYEEALAQMRAALGDGQLHDSNIVGWNLETQPELFLVNTADSWRLRPEPRTKIRNFFLSGDFVRTETDLACMESANESARRAVNELLEVEDPRERLSRCDLWRPCESLLLSPIQEMDQWRYDAGLPWSGVNIGQAVVGAAQAIATSGDFWSVIPGGERVRSLLFDAPKDRSSDRRFPLEIPAALPQTLDRKTWDPVPSAPVVGLNRDQIEEKRGNRFAQPGRDDAMFRRWRLFELAKPPSDSKTNGHSGPAKGPFLVPFQSYDADALIIYGKAAKLDFLRQLTADTGYYPVSSVDDGEPFGFAELWIIDYRDTMVGSYQEVAVNFVVTKDAGRPRYKWRSPYTILVPMMDSRNSLFTPSVLLDQKEDHKIGPGAVDYGRMLLSLDKRKATVEIKSQGDHRNFSFVEERNGVPPAPKVKGRIDLRRSLRQTLAVSAHLMAEMGVVESLKNAKQLKEQAELSGVLVARKMAPDGTKDAKATVPVRAAYKFSPSYGVLQSEEGEPLPKVLEFMGKGNDDVRPENQTVGDLLLHMGFEPMMAAHDPHLKSIFYVDGWPTPDDS